MIYLIGSLRNPHVPTYAATLRGHGWDVFDDWISVGPNADDEWQRYELLRGRTYTEALAGEHARDVFEFDLKHLEKAHTAVLILPAGKSAHLELGWMIGKGKKGYILLDGEPSRFDIMYKFAHGIYTNLDDLVERLEEDERERTGNQKTPTLQSGISGVYRCNPFCPNYRGVPRVCEGECDQI